ncbi:flagellar basal body rod protein FlgC [Shewanella sp. SR43-4]|jgi:flagellar basal-body rod protein FlgC|uniref:Flagellar basal-body rod protein FlgC n=1 Tax=Shewanella vesiculosa TaxID=518738 RepID=A0ABV0FJE6_9GAMM|nr:MULTISPECIES: flagellar basal body rod protein FlgC [Shewanella]NCQ45533.1 flagellar basal body rod protein FlgC [Shewanella frigidimarina]MBB1318176.1 flagellar basal body rod protein FlgC [Shewanella sp. SR43-4]MBB1320150.1 flagellar basal body rod protein FlgC [Shewanella sp. SR43-8]MBB1391106.1 flagellar basal body rod protein FlgC [Shewanella sp. SG44-6]MBB1477745.1 flagellar basal body rod protein FlgC [Shewanella sp. SG41-3]|tara:strand:+ start:2851 stop:3267 length:417 start_codon:yes stop_codon:yes gene_type:complete
MSLFNIFNVSGSGMSAQSVRLNTTASNIANADSVSSSVDKTYRARHPIFEAEMLKANSQQNSSPGVNVKGIVESDKPLIKEYSPDHPMADGDGFIYKPNVNVMEEMADMISASRSYQMNVQVADATKSMLQQTLRMGK